MEGYLCTELFRKSPFQCHRGCNCASQAKKSLLGVNSVRSATDRDGRCKCPSTMVFAKMALEAAAGRFSLNPLSASRFTDVDPRTCYNCK